MFNYKFRFKPRPNVWLVSDKKKLLLLLPGTVDALEKEQRDVSSGCGASEPDQTIEILMSDLDPAVMEIFTRAYSGDAAQATRVSRRVFC